MILQMLSSISIATTSRSSRWSCSRHSPWSAHSLKMSSRR
ncbi:hypothetical protein EVA_08254 [gut metagenome]|uniref:Uncharacterized protein n=1 Tax=gut metagenome TaxID=749906 RepID=J9GMZ3_9ZZZZ